MDQDADFEDTLEEQAAIWCLRALGQSSEPFDESAFQTWIEQSAAHREAFDNMARTWAGLEGLDYSAATSAPHAAETEAAPIADRVMINRRRLFAIAASAAAVTVGGIAYRTSTAQIYETATGQRSVVKLEDGSSLSLDGASKVQFRTDGSSRTAWLEQGRASFEVAHDPLRPFSVHVDEAIVVAIGTAFSVEQLSDEIRAELYSGKIEVIDGHETPDVRHYQLLNQGDRFTARNDGSKPIVTHNNSSEGGSWIQGILNFDNEALSVAVERMNRYSTRQIALPPDLYRQKVSGIFKAGETAQFVTAVCQLLNLRAEYNGNSIRLASVTA
jgi:transmembrane sensor